MHLEALKELLPKEVQVDMDGNLIGSSVHELMSLARKEMDLKKKNKNRNRNKRKEVAANKKEEEKDEEDVEKENGSETVKEEIKETNL